MLNGCKPVLHKVALNFLHFSYFLFCITTSLCVGGIHVRYLKLWESDFKGTENIISCQHCVTLAMLQLQTHAHAHMHLLGSNLIVWKEGIRLYSRTWLFPASFHCILPLSFLSDTWLEPQKQTGRLSSVNYMHSQWACWVSRFLCLQVLCVFQMCRLITVGLAWQ